MDMLEYAVQMELDGRDYYEKQAMLHTHPQLKAAFEMLAREEAAHAELLVRREAGLPVVQSDPQKPVQESLFSGLADFKMDTAEIPNALDAYRAALEKERESIALYRKMLAENAEAQGLFEFLIRQEEEHHAILEEIVKLVDRPHSWVEAAEFGLREEY